MLEGGMTLIIVYELHLKNHFVTHSFFVLRKGQASF